MKAYLVNLIAPVMGYRNWHPDYGRNIRKPIRTAAGEVTTDRLVERRWTGEAWEYRGIPAEELDELQWWQAVK